MEPDRLQGVVAFPCSRNYGKRKKSKGTPILKILVCSDVMKMVMSYLMYHDPLIFVKMLGVNKAFKQALDAGHHWTALALAVCGKEFMVPLPSDTQHDERYIAILRMRPWLSEPRIIRFDTRSKELCPPLSYQNIENVSVNEEQISILMRFDGGVKKAVVYPKNLNGLERVCDAMKHVWQDPPQQDSEMRLSAIRKLDMYGMLPEEFHPNKDVDYDISVTQIHSGAIAIMGEGTDIYIFSMNCTQFFARLNAPERGNRPRLFCSGPYLFVVSDARLTVFGPRFGQELRHNVLYDDAMNVDDAMPPPKKPLPREAPVRVWRRYYWS